MPRKRRKNLPAFVQQGNIRYDGEHESQAKEKGLHLVTLDIKGKHAKRDGVTFQGVLLSDDEVQRAWDFFEWLTMGRYREQAGKEPVGETTPTVT